MSNDSLRTNLQPESVSSEHNESLHEFLEEELEGNTYRRKALPGYHKFAEECESYLEVENPREEFPEMGSDLLKEALDDKHRLNEVTEYSIRGYGSIDEAIVFGVEYTIGNNFEPEAVAESKSSSSTRF